MTVNELKQQYVNVERVKKGGQKTVYKATKPGGATVALKLIVDATDQRVLQEIEIVRRLALDNVPRIYQSGIVTDDTTGNDVLYIEEEYIDGRSLRDWLDEGNRFDLLQTIDALEFLLNIECALEQENILHRDIKPDNLILGSDGQMYLIDFGLAKSLDGASLTLTGAFNAPFTPGYAPSEQVFNLKNEQDVRTDLYQIGVTVYECCTGNNPFIQNGDTVLQTIVRSISVIPDRANIAGDQHGSLSQLIGILMAPYQSQRPDTAQQALEYLTTIKAELGMEI